MSEIYGYIRVSTREQNENRQMDALSEFSIPRQNLFLDKQSGKDFKRPAYSRMMRRIKPGDLIYVKSIDRLGRNYAEIIEQWRVITKEKKADIRVLDIPLLDTTYGKDLMGTFVADLTLQIMSFTAQLERDNIRQRQAEGIVAAKARGVKFGCRQKELPADFELRYLAWRKGAISGEELAEDCGIALGTLYRKLREREVELPEKYRKHKTNMVAG